MYEAQRERQEKQVEQMEREVSRLNALTLDLENENYSLSSGKAGFEDNKYLSTKVVRPRIKFSRGDLRSK